MKAHTETYEQMLDRAHRAPHATACAIMEHAQAEFRKSRDQVDADYKARFGFSFA